MLFLTALLCVAATAASAQTRTLTGTVIGPDNQPVVGATVFATDGHKNNVPLAGTTTDASGGYSLNVPETAAQITVQFIGYETQHVAVGGGKSVYDFSLKDSSVMMEEVVAIGYAKVKRKDVTGSTVSVSGKDLAQIPVMTAAQALQGKATGVNIVTQSGAPGAPTNVVIRGGTSITQETKPLYIVDGFEMEDALDNININDIETIDVIKDASSSAIYGARGSNGVIIITTKGAQKGKTLVQYNTYFSFDTLSKKLDMIDNAEDFVKYQYEFQNLNSNMPNYALLYDGRSTEDADFYPGVYSRIAQLYGNARAIDWQDEIFGGYALTQNHNVNISMGTEKTQVMLSYNFNDQNGLTPNHSVTKNSVRAKVNSELYKGIRLDFNASFNNNKTLGGGAYSGMKYALLQPITGGVLYTDDELLNSELYDSYKGMSGSGSWDIANPNIQNLASTSTKRSRLFNVNAGIEVDFLKHFTFRTAGSYTWAQTNTRSFADERSLEYINNENINGSISDKDSYRYQITNTLSYNQEFNRHKLGVLLGQEVSHSESMSSELKLKNFPLPNFGLDDISKASPDTWKSGHSHSGIVSAFARVNYSFDDRYLLTATLRADGSSKFARGNKWGVFPSVSGAWRISEEKFWKEGKIANVINGLKLRAGYGTTGNCNINDASYTTNISQGDYPIGGSTNVTYQPGDTLGNPELKWETVIATNVGLELAMFNNRLNITAEWYNNESKDLLMKCNIPTSTGYKFQYQNVGELRNRGFELGINSVNIQTRNVRWTSDLNLSFNKSKVLHLENEETEYKPFTVGNSGRNGTVYYRAIPGESLGAMYGFVYDGIYTTDDFVEAADGKFLLRDGVVGYKNGTPQPGDIKYAADDVDADGRPIFSSKQVKIGDGSPLFTGGFNNTVTFFGFDVSIFLKFSYGNDIFNATKQSYSPYVANENVPAEMGTNFFRLIDPSTGHRATDLATIARLNPDQGGRTWSLDQTNNKTAVSYATSYFVEDGSYLRIGQITLGYTLPKKILQKVRISNARFYFTVNNVATLTGYSGFDPEVSATESICTPGVDQASYPRSRSYVVGLNLSF